MNTNKAGQLNGKSKPNELKVCLHQRMVSFHYNAKGHTTGNVVCQECGAVFPDRVKVKA